ncbi:MAG: hypothetical protein JJU29_09360 [Verrucomicrobia bacterium]|nr:hypothetical protein [Verrucomicrobiota bacterium]MCH8511721.1 hypothetical protein [Kiritimatiellia bacterium]
MKKLRLLLLGFPLFFPFAYGQQVANQEDITVRVQALSAGNLEIEGLFWVKGQEWEQVQVPVEFLSTAESYTGPNPITFYREGPPEDGEEAPGYVPVAQVRIPANTDEVVILFQEREQQIAGTAIPLRAQNFPQGSYMVFNRSGQDVVMSLDGAPATLASGGVQVIRPENRERRPIPVVLQHRRDPENRSLITTTWFYHPERRRFVFLLPEEDRIQVRSIGWFPGNQE